MILRGFRQVQLSCSSVERFEFWLFQVMDELSVGPIAAPSMEFREDCGENQVEEVQNEQSQRTKVVMIPSEKV